MHVNSVKLVYFSPTKTTERIVKCIAQGVRIDTDTLIDLTPPEVKTQDFEKMHDELVIMGVPVYGGRVPPEAVQRLRRIRGNGTVAVVVVVYGNRAYEDALLELRDLAVEQGFRPIAGGAFIGEHSYSSKTVPIATGRPDEHDLEKAKRFGELIREKIGDIHMPDEISPVHMPGAFPYRKWNPPSDISPVTDQSRCTLSGICAAVCPMAAITVGDAVLTDRRKCIMCSACVKNCPSGARTWEDPWIKRITKWVSMKSKERKEPEMFL